MGSTSVNSLLDITSNSSYVLTDTSVNVANHIADLMPYITSISSINLSDTGPLSITATQLSLYTSVLSKITSYTLAVSGVSLANLDVVARTAFVATISITDSSAKIASNIDVLQANVTKISSITQTDTVAPLAITATQLASDGDALRRISGTYTLAVSAVAVADIITTLSTLNKVTSISISDSSSIIANNLEALQSYVSNSQVTSITQTGTAAPLGITKDQLTSNASALAKISGTYTLAVSGVSIEAMTKTLNTAKVASISISDSSENIAKSLDALQLKVLKISSITKTVTAAPLAITMSQITSDAATLAKISGGYSLAVSAVPISKISSTLSNSAVTSISISDSSTNIAINLDSLQSYVSNSIVTSITQTGTALPLAITVAQLTSNASALAKISGTYTLAVSGVSIAAMTTMLDTAKVASISISDSSENIAKSLDELQSIISNSKSKISSINLTDIDKPLAITVAELSSYAAVLAKISGDYSLTIPAISVAQMSTVLTNSHVLPVSISDSSANIASKLDALKTYISNGKVASITQTGTVEALAITAKQLTSAISVFAKISGTYTLAVSEVSIETLNTVLANTLPVTSISISDTTANIAKNLDFLQTYTDQISSIIQTGTVSLLAITSTQLSNDASALGKMGSYSLTVSAVAIDDMDNVFLNSHVTSFSISDSSANIAANWDDLKTNISKISSITQTGTVVPLAITVAQLSSHAAVLAKISGLYTLTIPAILIAEMKEALANKYVASFAINDSSANIDSNLDALQTNNSDILSITQTGTIEALAITATQYNRDTDALAKISNSYSLLVSSVSVSGMATFFNDSHVTSFSISDSSANIAANWDDLKTNISKISSITQTTGTVRALAITATQFSTHASVLAKISAPYSLAISAVSVEAMPAFLLNSQVTSVFISDSSANIATNLDVLQTNIAKISSITFTGTSATLAITSTQLSTDASVLAKISGSYFLTISAIPFAKMSSVLANFHVTSFSISDSSANIATNLDALQTNVSKISSITQTGTVAALAITATQLSSDAATLAKISGDYSLAVSGVPVSAITSTLANTKVASVAINDSSTNIASKLDALQTNISKISSITQTGTIAPLIINATQLTNDALALAKISGVYFLVVSSTPVAVLASAFANSHVTSLSISDSSANIAANLDVIQANLSKISSITQTGIISPLAISATQLTSDALALAKISGVYSLAVSGIPIAEMNSVLANSYVNSLSIIDSEANFTANLSALNAKVASISSIILIDSHVLALSIAQETSAATLLKKIVGGYTLTTNVMSTANLNTLATSLDSTLFIISDSSANIASNLDALQTNVNKISSISQTGTIAPLVISATQLTNNALALAKISGDYSLTIPALSVAAINTVLANSHVSSISITDTNTNFIASLSTLNDHVNLISSITLTGSHVLTITAAQQTADAALLTKIVGGYTLGVNAAPNQTMTGTAGIINTVIFSEPLENFKMTVSDSSTTLVDTVSALGTNTLINIQRAQFSDGTAIALDFAPSQNGYLTAMLIGTAFGSKFVSTYFMPGVSLFDAGQKFSDIATLIVDLNLIETQIGSTSNKDWVNFVYKNVMGVAPNSVDEVLYVNALDNGTNTKATLLAGAFNAAVGGIGSVADQISLVGLQTNGLIYNFE